MKWGAANELVQLMYFRTSLVLLALVLSGLAHADQVYADLSSQPTGVIHFNSANPKSKWDLVHRRYGAERTAIWGTLSMPANAQGRVPAMVISHGSNGVSKKLFERWAKVFNDMGIAAFVVDSFAPRGVNGTMEDQTSLSPAVNDVDALFALKLLATDPRIDARRIGMIGFSRGGTVALEMAMESFRRGVIDDDLRFAALIAFYPGCSQIWWEVPAPALTGAPLMLALGEKDDYTPARLCLNFVPRMQHAGQAVEVHVYPDSYHDFDNTEAYFKYHAGATSANRCPQVLFDSQHGTYYRLAGGEQYPSLKSVQDELKTCLIRGVSSGANLQQGARSVEDVKVFLGKAFQLQ
ncbi:dienelactone hydrolase family protein [Herbaspirillum sp. alder98]|uniref:dienelactone hydrolase family protein n=1 Tax=Herbaspirillum sp. alder98 TaxID=2913096 RepID=UPI001CD8D790|nr:dienelactone hydrolase family protein [Herbaspirillum sp. alder98]MCA1323744.1 dienelactone hydrolase family protein [Herbaspirillum sp. alder98]